MAKFITCTFQDVGICIKFSTCSILLITAVHVLFEMPVPVHVPVLNLLEVPVLEYDLNLSLASSTTAQYKVTTSSWIRLAQYIAKSY